VTLAGGEPFIREDLFDIICAAKSQGLACNLFSNGTLLDRRRSDRLFECRVDKVIISIDGIGPVHDAVRGIPGTYDKALAALSALVAERRERGAAGPEIDVHMTLLKENVSSLAPLYNVCRSLGVNFSFQPYSETHETVVRKTELNGAAIGSPRYLAHEDSLHFSARQVGQIREAVLGLPPSFYTKLLLSFSDAQLQQGRMPVRKCYITRHFMMIDPYGGVYPCTNLDGYIVGSVRDQALARIWNGEKYDALRQKLSRRLLPVCDYCCHPADNLSLAQLAALLLTRNSRSS
jgi:radical SAM protein with 4Fe4S-binding SPASM domain